MMMRTAGCGPHSCATCPYGDELHHRVLAHRVSCLLGCPVEAGKVVGEGLLASVATAQQNAGYRRKGRHTRLEWQPLPD